MKALILNCPNQKFSLQTIEDPKPNNGFAVAIVDAFYKKNIKSNQKTKFPQAKLYAKQIASYFSKNPELDSNNFFYKINNQKIMLLLKLKDLIKMDPIQVKKVIKLQLKISIAVR